MGIENLLLGFHIAITPYNLFVAVIGITLGTIIGVLPGLGGANGVAILLPLTFTMPPTSAIILLTSLYWGALFGGAITSILFNIPGEPWSVATTFDGYPMARQGRSGQALTAAFTSSFVGAFFSIALITFFAPLLAEVALKFGPPEFFAIQLLTFSSFVGLGGGNPMKSLVSILIGFIMAAVGLDIVTGALRLTFGFTDLMTGFDLIVAVLGPLGTPGSPTAAVMLGGLIIWGLQPGPMLFKEKPEFVWGLIASMYTGNVIGVAMVLAFVPLFAAILRVPFAILTPLIVSVCAVGAYSVNGRMIDIWYMLIFGVVGYAFKKLDYPLAPLVLALVLGDLAENALRQSLIMSHGSLLIFLERPISGAITAVALFFFALPAITPWLRRLRGAPVAAVKPRET